MMMMMMITSAQSHR